MTKDTFDSGVLGLHKQLTALTRAVAGIRPELLGISPIAAATAGLRSAAAPTLAAGLPSAIMKSSMVGERILGGGLAASIARGAVHPERMFNNPALSAMRDIERATRPFGLEAAIMNAARPDIGTLGGIAPIFKAVAGAVPAIHHPHQALLQSVIGATRRVALAGIAGGLDDGFASAMRASGFLSNQTNLLARIAGLVAEAPGLEELADPLRDAASATEAALVGGEADGDRLRELWSRLNELLSDLASRLGGQVDRQRVMDAIGIVALFIAFIGLAQGALMGEADVAARQRRILENQQDIQRYLRQLSQGQRNAERQITGLANRIAVQPLRFLVTKARLHERPTGRSRVVTTLRPRDTVILVRVEGRWALVEVELDGRVGWMPKKALRR